MLQCCPFFRRRKQSFRNGEPLLLSNKVLSEDSSPSSIQSYGDTRKRSEDELETTRESSRSISKMNRCEDDEFGGVSLHLTRLSCEERQFSWQVRTAIELEESLNPLILTAIEKEESIDDKTNEDESSDGKEEGNEDEMHTALEWTQGYRDIMEEDDDEMLMETALEYIDGGDEKDDEEKIHSLTGIECENGEDKGEWMLSEEKNEIEGWIQSVESNDGKLDETDGFGTGIVLISKGGNESLCTSTSVISLSIDPSLQSVDLSTPAKSTGPLSTNILKQPRSPSFINF